jgi:hypothetical protein
LLSKTIKRINQLPNKKKKKSKVPVRKEFLQRFEVERRYHSTKLAIQHFRIENFYVGEVENYFVASIQRTMQEI